MIEEDGKVVTAQQKEMEIVAAVTKSIIAAIEDLGDVPITEADGTIGATVKDKVAEKLRSMQELGGPGTRNLVTVGKAVISGLKAQNVVIDTQKSS